MRVPPFAKPAVRAAAPGATRAPERLARRTLPEPASPALRFDVAGIGIVAPGHGATISLGDPHDPAERAAARAATEVMRMDVPDPVAISPGGARGTSSGELLDRATRAFFEPRFGVDLGSVRVHRDAAATASAARLGAEAYTLGRDIVYGPGTQPGVNALTAHELAHVARGGDGPAAVVRRQPRADVSRFRIISQIWRVSGRDIVVVETDGGVRRAFYRRTGLADKGPGSAPPPGGWAPFQGLEPHAGNPTRPWFNKTAYYTNVHPNDPLRGYGNTLNREIAGWLDGQYVTGGQTKPWEQVRREMDDVIRRPSLAPVSPPAVTASGEIGGRGKPGPAPSPSSAPPAGGKVEGGAARAESAAGKLEGKALTAEAGLAEAAGAAAKGSRAARLGKFLLMAAMPGPLDVLFLYVGFFGSIAEAKAKLRQRYYALGFSEGLGASLLGIPRSEATDMLVKPGGQPGIGARVAGFEGVRDRATHSGVVEGLRFAARLTSEQRVAFLREGFAVIAQKGHTVGPNFDLDDVIELAIALKPLVEELLALAQEQEAERRKQEMVRRMYEDTESMWQK